MAPVLYQALLLTLLPSALALPALSPRDEASPSPVVSLSDLNAQASTIVASVSAVASPPPAVSVASAYSSLLGAIVPSPAPTSIEQAIALAVDASQREPKDVISNALRLSLQGLSVYDPKDLLSSINVTSSPPPSEKRDEPIHPRSSPSDAPYSLPESQLRSALTLPAGFTSNANQLPVLLIPGTAVPSSQTFPPNLLKLLPTINTRPAYLSIPGNSLGDAQLTAEYVAYAISTLSALSPTGKIALITWSQGSLNAQWALKYWPSLRPKVSDLVAISPDFHGTLDASVFCPALSFLPCPAAVRQQAYSSAFVRTLRANGGDGVYVPTTTIYSATDVVVTPQTGGVLASGYLNGASNNEVQSVCAGKGPAAGAYTHQGMLYHPLAWALVVDALGNEGPGRAARVDLNRVCGLRVAEGLELGDVLATQSVSVVAGAEVLRVLASGGVWREPGIMGYAR